jgi:hypothetical protein
MTWGKIPSPVLKFIPNSSNRMICSSVMKIILGDIRVCYVITVEGLKIILADIPVCYVITVEGLGQV